VRDERWKLIRYPLVDRTQFFDLGSDPHEQRNLAADPAHQATLARLRTLLEQEAARWGDKAAWTSPNVRPAVWTPPAVMESAAKRWPRNRDDSAGLQVSSPLWERLCAAT
jgi:arylsulfatase A-like enzyme